MDHGKRAPRRTRGGLGAGTAALLPALALAVVIAAGGTLAWLLDSTAPVTNVFTPSDISIALEESATDFRMIPGWIIPKDPKVTVAANSEDCWLFVKITPSAAPSLDDYIAYAVASGWEQCPGGDGEGNAVIARRVTASTTDQQFGILGAGSYTGSAGTVTWDADQVGVKPEVTEAMMAAITGEGKAQPTLTFQAAAVQLYKSNGTAFGMTEALEQVTWSGGI